MFRIKHSGIEKSRTRGSDMEIGDLAWVTESGSYRGSLILRTYSGYVSLSNPNNTWDRNSADGLAIEKCPPGFSVTLVVE